MTADPSGARANTTRPEASTAAAVGKTSPSRSPWFVHESPSSLSIRYGTSAVPAPMSHGRPARRTAAPDSEPAQKTGSNGASVQVPSAFPDPDVDLGRWAQRLVDPRPIAIVRSPQPLKPARCGLTARDRLLCPRRSVGGAVGDRELAVPDPTSRR